MIENKLSDILPLLLDVSLVPDGENLFELKNGSGTWYSRLSVNPAFTKPKKKDIVFKYQELEDQRKSKESERYDQESIIARLKNINDIRWCMKELSITDFPNVAKFVKHIAESIDFDLVEQIEQKDLEYSSMVAQQKQDDIAMSKDIKEVKNMIKNIEDNDTKKLFKILFRKLGL